MFYLTSTLYMRLDLQNHPKSHKNWNPIYCWTLDLHSYPTQKHQIRSYMAKSAFTDGFLLTLSNHQGALQGLWSQWMALIRMWVVPDCCQQLSQPILLIESVSVTYWRHNIAVCVLMEDITRLRLPTHPTTHPTLSHLPTPYNMPFMIL